MTRPSRSRQRQHESVSLFSFIDVLGGLIGALSLIIISVSLSQVVPEAISTSPLSTQISFTESEIQQKNAQIKELRQAIAGMTTNQVDLQSARNQLVNLRHQVSRTVNQRYYIAQLLKEKQELHKRIVQMEEQRDELQHDISQLNTKVLYDQNMIERDRIEIHFTGRGRNLRPIFVECANDGLVIRDAGKSESVHWRNVANSDKFHVLLDRTKATAGGIVIFLVRPDGIRAFNLALAEADKREVRRGKLPIPGQGEIDLGQFEEQLSNENAM